MFAAAAGAVGIQEEVWLGVLKLLQLDPMDFALLVGVQDLAEGVMEDAHGAIETQEVVWFVLRAVAMDPQDPIEVIMGALLYATECGELVSNTNSQEVTKTHERYSN